MRVLLEDESIHPKNNLYRIYISQPIRYNIHVQLKWQYAFLSFKNHYMKTSDFSIYFPSYSNWLRLLWKIDSLEIKFCEPSQIIIFDIVT